MNTRALNIFLCLFMVCIASCFNSYKHQVPDSGPLHLPEGFHVNVFSDKVHGARSMTLGTKGTVFVGTREGDKVYAVTDDNNDGVADNVYTIVRDMECPNGVAFHDGSLYIAQVDKVWRLDNVEKSLNSPGRPVLVFDSLPSDQHHGWKYIAFGPDGKLYIPIGAPCNVCDESEKDQRYASMCRMNPDGSGFELFASGIRNTVGFDWHPQTHELWFTDNGRDMMGDDLPPDELNNASHAGMHFGFPFCHGNSITDPEFGKKRPCTDFTQPAATLGPHVAALGMKFYTGNMFPSQYKNSVFIAEHGSWNRSKPIGYRVTTVTMKDGKAVYEPFAEGWLNNDDPVGRPVDILQLKDGSLLVSDDMAGKIYRITYSK